MKILVINGPNLNMLGIREPEIYGSDTYENLTEMIRFYAGKKNISVEIFQSNHEGALIDVIQRAYFELFDGIILNPAGYTHTSVAIADAVKAVSVTVPTVEVHLSDISKREAFRQNSFVSPVARATVMGEGFEGYLHAMDILAEMNGK